MALELKGSCEKCGGRLLISGVAYICSYECTYCARCAERMNFVCPNCKVNLCGGRAASSRLVPPALVLDSIGEKTLVADRAHADQRTMHAGGKEFLAQAC